MTGLNFATALIVAFAFILTASPSLSQFERARRSVPANSQTHIQSFWDCRNDIIQSVSGQAERGSVTTREAKEHRCGNRTQRTVQAIYTPPAGYRGPDDVYIDYGGFQIRLYLDVK